ncbi:ABC-type antimicrobial peptide transport system permease subunit [Runella defluvii]|uniref:ABC-type antimicrobial peptide transport system permease subunit n=1 Tax=Runella defluvii TaxID=370973 RepID=A0A7W6EU54_9BACT|nr:ABC transporter permease [Runella defluvii]MBB3842056.1 ABC-type antimicrobial peptide transport system permease subunit [Runella defluvii]
MKTNELHPPQWANRVLRWLHPEDTLEEVEGDLEELYAYWYERAGKGQATWRYLLNVASVLPPFVRRRERKQAYHNPFLIQPSMLRNYFTIAFRTLAHNKVYSSINVIGLSIGLAAAMLIMLYTKDEVSFDRFHANNPHIYRITSKQFTPAGAFQSYNTHTGYLQGPKFAAGVPEIKMSVRYQSDRSDIKVGTEVKSFESFHADSSFFALFSFPLVSGNPATALREPKSVVLSEEMAEKQFGTTNALGKILLVRNSNGDSKEFEPYTVTGIAKKCPQNSSIKFDFLFPYVVSKEDMANEGNWFNFFQNTFVVLEPNANLKKVEATMNRIFEKDAKQAMEEEVKRFGPQSKMKYMLQPFTDMHLNKDMPAQNGLVDGSNPMFSYILSGIALFILLIACINFVNLTVARSLKRAKEIGVRKVVGGGRAQLMMQFLGESFILCFLAFGFALLLVQMVLPTFNELSNKALAFSYLFDAKLIAGYFALFAATGLLAGFYPALVLSNYNPVQTLYSRFNLSGKNYLQKGLVVLQFALASFLIIATLTIYSQFNYLTNKDLGYNDKGIVMVNKSGLSRNEAKVFKDELLKNQNIRDVAPKNGGNWYTVAKVNGQTEINFAYETVDATYFPLLQIPIIKGRNFSAEFNSDSTSSILVNETFVKKAGWTNPLGQVVDFWYNEGEKYKVVGVVKDFHFESLNAKISPQLFTMKPGNQYGKVFIKIKEGSETASLSHLAKTYKKLFPTNPYEYKFMDEENEKRYESEAKWKQIMLFGAILTIFISCIGLFGLATLSAERRTKEIGIRKVLGASVASITTLLSADFLKLVSLSFVFAFPVAYYAIKEWLENYPYRIDISVWTFVIAAALSILIAFFTVSFQSIKAALGNPVKSLKAE